MEDKRKPQCELLRSSNTLNVCVYSPAASITLFMSIDFW